MTNSFAPASMLIKSACIKMILLPMTIGLMQSCSTQHLKQSDSKDINDVESIMNNGDGTFRVKCLNGAIEVVTADDIAMRQVCTFNIAGLSREKEFSRYGHTSVIIGEKLIIWGGRRGRLVSDGEIFDLSKNTWTKLSEGPLSARLGHTAVAVGTKMIIWGGADSERLLSDGAIYDSVSAEWSILPRTDLMPRSWHSAVAIGDRVIIWGGDAGNNMHFSDGGIFDVATNRWSSLPANPISPILPRGGHTASAIGDKMIVFGGYNWGHRPNARLSDGAIYDASLNTWTMLAAGPLSSVGRARHSSVAYDNEMVIWGGNFSGINEDGPVGAVFNILTNEWKLLPDGSPPIRATQTASLFEGRIIFWGGIVDSQPVATGFAFDITNGQWISP